MLNALLLFTPKYPCFHISTDRKNRDSAYFFGLLKKGRIVRDEVLGQVKRLAVESILPVHRTNLDLLNLFLSVPTQQNREIGADVKFSYSPRE